MGILEPFGKDDQNLLSLMKLISLELLIKLIALGETKLCAFGQSDQQLINVDSSLTTSLLSIDKT